MKPTLHLTVVLLFACAIVRPQESPHLPFAKLEQQVRDQQGGWNGDKRKLSTIFAEERQRLGNGFEAALMKYIDGDPEKHYWTSLFLKNPSYLHGHKPLPYVSLLVMEQGLSLLRDKTEDDSVGRSLKLNVVAAVLAQELGLTTLAISHKNSVERRLSENSEWGAYFPWMSEEDTNIYDALPTIFKRPVDERFSDMPRAGVIAGVINDKAKTLPMPIRNTGEASGQVTVAIVYDENGKVIWARAISGPSLLRKSAEAAAFKATFAPFKFDGKPQKVSGTLIYDFR